MRLVSALWGDFYPFQENFPEFKEFSVVNYPDDLKEGDVLIVWGGEDISPYLYDQPLNPRGDGDVAPSRRDRLEWNLMVRAVELKIPIIGICRGAQMLCALAGGTLYQHVDNHAGRSHDVHTHDDKIIHTNSVHHQMMNPTNTNCVWVGWTTPKSHGYHESLFDAENEHEPIHRVVQKHHGERDAEFLYFPDQRGFAIQWHPEFLSEHDDESTLYVCDFIRNKLKEFGYV